MARVIVFFVLISGFAVTNAFSAFAFEQGSPNQITAVVDDAQVVTLAGNVHPLARAEFDQGAIAPETHLDRLVLLLQPSPAQRADLDALVAAQQDPGSALFHNWLTPAQYAVRFGATHHDLTRISNWLQEHGLTVDEIPAGNSLVVFSGTAEQVEETFHTGMHRFLVEGVSHIANLQDPQIPKALAGVVAGIVSLHDFRRTAASTVHQPLGDLIQVSRESSHLSPSGFASIYDLHSLYSAGITGAGVNIAIIGRSSIHLEDVDTFRSTLGLSPNSPAVVAVGPNPGFVSGDEEAAILAVEWSGALAPAASVQLVTAASTEATDGVDLAAQYAVNHPSATILSIGFSSCESEMGHTELAFYNALWEQAASEGITAIVSSGNSGAAGCAMSAAAPEGAPSVNGLCSSQYSACVGGTEFSESLHQTKSDMAVAEAGDNLPPGYLPERVWNESGDRDALEIRASGGGVSTIYAQPDWQKNIRGTGAAQGMRAVPDVALAAATNNGFMTYQKGAWWSSGGTAAASSAFAAIMALVVQSNAGNGQGNINPSLYRLLDRAPIPFHATSLGDNSVPGVPGFSAIGEPFNMATGLGSINGFLFVSQLSAETGFGNSTLDTPNPPQVSSPDSSPIADVVGITTGSFSGPSGIKLNAASSQLALMQGFAANDVFTLTAVGSFHGPVSLAVSGLPNGVVASWSANPVLVFPSQPTTVTLTLAASAGTPLINEGNFVVTANTSRLPPRLPAVFSGKADNLSRVGGGGNSAALTTSALCKLQVIPAPPTQMQLSNPTLSMQSTSTTSLTILVTQTGVINSSVAISVGSAPSGVAFALSAPALNGTSGTSTVLTLTGSSFAQAGTYTIPLNVTATDPSGSSTAFPASITLNLD
jgi:hypothetical protein